MYESAIVLVDWLPTSHPNPNPSTPDNANIVFRFYIYVNIIGNLSTQLKHTTTHNTHINTHYSVDISQTASISDSMIMQSRDIFSVFFGNSARSLSLAILYFLPLKSTIKLPLINAIIFNDSVIDIWCLFFVCVTVECVANVFMSITKIDALNWKKQLKTEPKQSEGKEITIRDSDSNNSTVKEFSF